MYRQCFLNATSINCNRINKAVLGRVILQRFVGLGWCQSCWTLGDASRCCYCPSDGWSEMHTVSRLHSFQISVLVLKESQFSFLEEMKRNCCGNLVQRSRLWEFDAVGVGAGSELWRSCGKLWECHRCRKVAPWGPGTHKEKKKTPKLTPNPACYLDSSGAPSMIWMVAFFIPWNQEMSRTTFTTGCVISQLIIF